MKYIEIKETNVNTENEKFEIRYRGISEIYEELPKEINEEIEEFINNDHHEDMYENVKRIRTILKDFEEDLLLISYKSGLVSDYVGYNNGKLIIYEKREGDPITYKFVYNPRMLKVEDSKNNIMIEENISEQMSLGALEFMKIIDKFNNININELKRSLKKEE